MSSAAGSRSVELGPEQRPRLSHRPKCAWSYADDAAFLAAGYGLSPDPWQFHVLEGWLGRTAGGSRWSALSCGLSISRQNGKNAIIEVRELFGMIALGEKFAHTAHEVKTARKAFLRIASFFENPDYPELGALCTEIRRTNGQEAITLRNGGSVEFVARSKSSGRGFTVDVLVCDEAQEMSDEDLEAIMPATSASPLRDPQWIFTGTPPGPKAVGEVFGRVRGDGVSGSDPRLCWDEWSLAPSEESGGEVDLDDRAVWYATNPGLAAGRLQIDVVEGERHRFSDGGFARERLGMWETLIAKAVIDLRLWGGAAEEGGLLDPASHPAGAPVFAVDVAPARTRATIAVGGRRPDGLIHVDPIDARPGAGWVAERLLELCERHNPAAVVLEGSGGAAALGPDIEAALNGNLERLRAGEEPVEGAQPRWPLLRPGPAQMAQACGQFYDAAVERRLRHIGAPVMGTALAGATKRPLENGWAWNRKDTAVDLTPLVSCTWAVWGVLNAPPPKRRYRAAGFN
jgi:hypothetical protein